jgi:hypothetical protein
MGLLEGGKLIVVYGDEAWMLNCRGNVVLQLRQDTEGEDISMGEAPACYMS